MASMTDEEEERESPQPHVKANIEKIAGLVGPNGQIAKAEERAQKARGELGNIYQKVENDYHGNRKAVKLIRTLVAGTEEAAHDFMRTFMHLAHRFALFPHEDLVDIASREQPSEAEINNEGKTTAAEKGPKKASATVHELPVRESAIERAQKQIATGGKPPAPAGPPGDTDLVEAADAVVDEKQAEIDRQKAEDAAKFDTPAEIEKRERTEADTDETPPPLTAA